MSSDRPIFVIGCARSGTTMLQLMIHAHRRLAMPAETRFLMPIYVNRADFGDLRDPANVDRVADFVIDRRKSRFRDLELDGPAVRRRMHDVPATLGSLMGSVFSSYADANGKLRWGDKRPNYVRHVPRILQMFPDAQFVHIIRDGRDSVSSLIGMRWWSGDFYGAVSKWKHAMDIAADLRQSLRPDQYMDFRYEDLVTAPRDGVVRLCEFLEEDVDEAMLDYYKTTKVPNWKTWHPNTEKPIHTGSLDRWRKDLTRSQLRLIESVAGPQLEANGYELSLRGPLRKPSRRSRNEWLEHVSAENHRFESVDLRERTLQDSYPHPVAAALTRGQVELARQQGWLEERTRLHPHRVQETESAHGAVDAAKQEKLG